VFQDGGTETSVHALDPRKVSLAILDVWSSTLHPHPRHPLGDVGAALAKGPLSSTVFNTSSDSLVFKEGTRTGFLGSCTCRFLEPLALWPGHLANCLFHCLGSWGGGGIHV
jgi:hypothetical protein